MLIAAEGKPEILDVIRHELEVGTDYFFNKMPQKALLDGINGHQHKWDETRTRQMLASQKPLVQIINGVPVGAADVAVNAADPTTWRVSLNVDPSGKASIADLGYWRTYANQKYAKKPEERAGFLKSVAYRELFYRYAVDGRSDLIRDLIRQVGSDNLASSGPLSADKLTKSMESTADAIEEAAQGTNRIDVLSHYNQFSKTQGLDEILDLPNRPATSIWGPQGDRYSTFAQNHLQDVQGLHQDEQANILRKAELISDYLLSQQAKAVTSLSRAGGYLLMPRPLGCGIHRRKKSFLS